MSRIIDGKAIAAELRENIRSQVAEQVEQGSRPPGLAVIIAGDDPASAVYVRNKERACAAAGFNSFGKKLPADVSEAELLRVIAELNEDPAVDGILCQLPLPRGIDERLVIDSILPEKDVDGFHPINAGKLLIGLPALEPCTPAGVIHMLQTIRFDFVGKRAVVIGRSNIVGKPMALMLLREHCTVTIAHSRTNNLAELCREADLLVSAVGMANLITPEFVHPEQVIIDVSINRSETGKLTGDVDFEAVAPLVRAITPVPGGVGPMTIAMLLQNTYLAYTRHLGIVR